MLNIFNEWISARPLFDEERWRGNLGLACHGGAEAYRAGLSLADDVTSLGQLVDGGAAAVLGRFSTWLDILNSCSTTVYHTEPPPTTLDHSMEITGQY